MNGIRAVQAVRELMGEVARMKEAAASGDCERAEMLASGVLQRWPGYSGGMVAWCMYWQLNPAPPTGGNSLDVVREVLKAACEVESSGFDAAYELGRFLFAVDDDPKTAKDLSIAEIGRTTERLRRFETLLKEANDELSESEHS